MKQSFKVGGLISLVVLLLIAQLLIPYLFTSKLETGIKAELDDVEELEADVAAFPALKIFLGRIDRLELTGQKLTDQQLTLDSLQATFSDLKATETDQGWQIVEGENTYLDLVISEESLSSYLQTRPELKLFEKFKVDITSDKVLITGLLSFFDAQVNLQLAGHFAVASRQQIVFKSDKLAVENILVPTEAIEELKNKLQFKFDLSKLPVPIKVEQVKLEKDQLRLLNE